VQHAGDFRLAMCNMHTLHRHRLKALKCFSLSVVLNKWFHLNPDKKFDADLQIRLVVSERNAKKSRILIPKNDVAGTKIRLLF